MWKIVEFNCINCAGFYKCNLQKLIIEIDNYFNYTVLSLTDEHLEKLLIDTGSFVDCLTEEDKQKMRDSYRKVEAENNQQIKEAGGITNWYESGRGRLL